jgi:hypothetical protein
MAIDGIPLRRDGPATGVILTGVWMHSLALRAGMRAVRCQAKGTGGTDVTSFIGHT